MYNDSSNKVIKFILILIIIGVVIYLLNRGEKKTPVVLHRAILGSIDRFIAYYLEETKGALPVWLAPLQVKIIPITDKQLDYAKEVYNNEQDNRDRDSCGDDLSFYTVSFYVLVGKFAFISEYLPRKRIYLKAFCLYLYHIGLS